MNIKLSALDQSPIREGETATEALNNTIILAQELEKFGYYRFWVSEHHDTKSLAGSSPEVLISSIAAKTKSIRVGSGGVMLHNYSSYKVAENFKVLEALYPNRIDLGVGRAPGGMPLATKALMQGKSIFNDDYQEKVLDLVRFIYDIVPEEHEFSGLKATPLINTYPEIHILGSSGGSAGLAAGIGASYAYAQFITGGMGVSSVNWYKDNFKKSIISEKPNTIICSFVICGETEEEINNQVAVMDLTLLLVEQGKALGMPTLERALAYKYSNDEIQIINRNRKRMIVGTPDKIKDEILNMSKIYNTEEFMIINLNTDLESKIKSYKLIAEAFRK
ncbi:LLM class flavin-dependent oxidoreductase [Clostridium sp. Sa3CUN1]|uniref:LLM class flavin-dependent oxidoreductase n=1 Tax=Clostridium gallinarum TaxID=2762246 RepID=A0ABR8Q4Y3_9CLOT|nr:LLM class flavin-dependent oxidoreductase [Clostridium gallinarum]MBD7915464.1 LLM class flavin-dependent oxidoreductase [Clostridium gallinarum]